MSGPRRIRAVRRITGTCAVVAGLLLAGCSQGNDYPEQVRLNFMTACIDQGGSRSACSCSFDSIEDEFSLDEYIDMEAEFLATGRMPYALTAQIRSCGVERTRPVATSTTADIAAEALSNAAADVLDDMRTVETFPLSIDATRLGTNLIGDETACIDVTVANQSSDLDQRLHILSFRLELPSGRLEQPTYADQRSEDFPTLAPGGTGSATMCFETAGERGAATLQFSGPFGGVGQWELTIE